MAIEEVHIGDIGTVFELTVKEADTVVDLSTATAMQIVFVKPDATKVTQTAVHVTDGTDGKMKYVTASGDLDQVGTWKIQGVVTLATGTWHSTIDKFKVYGNL